MRDLRVIGLGRGIGRLRGSCPGCEYQDRKLRAERTTGHLILQSCSGCWMRVPEKGSRELLRVAQRRDAAVGNTLAAVSAERKRVLQDPAEPLFERAAEQSARPEQPGLDRLGSQAKQFGGVLDTHSLDKAGDKNQSERLRQLVYRPLQDLPYLMLRHALFRV